MIWIIGSIVLILWGTVVMCALIAGGRADVKMIKNGMIRFNQTKDIESYEKEAP